MKKEIVASDIGLFVCIGDKRYGVCGKQENIELLQTMVLNMFDSLELSVSSSVEFKVEVK